MATKIKDLKAAVKPVKAFNAKDQKKVLALINELNSEYEGSKKITDITKALKEATEFEPKDQKKLLALINELNSDEEDEDDKPSKKKPAKKAPAKKTSSKKKDEDEDEEDEDEDEKPSKKSTSKKTTSKKSSKKDEDEDEEEDDEDDKPKKGKGSKSSKKKDDDEDEDEEEGDKLEEQDLDDLNELAESYNLTDAPFKSKKKAIAAIREYEETADELADASLKTLIKRAKKNDLDPEDVWGKARTEDTKKDKLVEAILKAEFCNEEDEEDDD